MNLPTIVLMPSVNAMYPCPGGTYVSNTNKYVFNALATDIPTLTGSYGGVLITPRNNTSASSNPSANNDYTQLYGPGSLWVNVSSVLLWLCTAMGPNPGTATWTAVAASPGTLIGDASSVTIKPSGASVARSLATLFADQCNNVKTFGAVGDGSTDDTIAIQAAITAALSNGSPVYFPPGVYRTATGITYDISASANQIPLVIGAGANRSVINCTASAPTFYMYGGSADGFFGGILNLGFTGNWAGPVLKLCDDSFTHAINGCIFTNVVVNNISLSTSGVAVKVNYLLNSVFSNLIASTGGVGTGKSLQLNQSSFNIFEGGSFSSAQYGVHITNGSNVGNRFDVPNIATVTNCVVQDSAGGNGRNKFIGGQFVWDSTTDYAIISSAGAKLIFDNVNFAPSAGSGDLFLGRVLDSANQSGVQILGDYGDGTSPAGGAPVSGTVYTNTTGQAQVVTVHPGSGTTGMSVVVNGTQTISDSTDGPVTVVIRPEYTIVVNWSTTPVGWVWFPLAV